MKKLVRLKKNRVLGGVLAGLGEYLSIDPVILRIAFIVLLLLRWFSWWLVLGYILCWIILPSGKASDQEGSAREIKEEDSIGLNQTKSKFVNEQQPSESSPRPEENKKQESSAIILIAILLIGAGFFLVFQAMIPNGFYLLIKRYSVAIILIGIGLILLFQNFFNKKGE
jgi:phage shock protein PspC (stress-responsive transcriptional regulator)